MRLEIILGICLALAYVSAGCSSDPKYLTLDLGKGVTMKLVRIPAGKFMMGSPKTESHRKDSEGPQREVMINKPFYIGIYEVTQAQWRAVMGTEPWARWYRNPPGAHVASGIAWDDASKFCGILSKKTGKKVALPSEAQWEYACRARSRTAYCFGDDASKLGDYAWTDENTKSERYAHAPGQKKPNAWGLYDMHGNVNEWCFEAGRCRGGSWGDSPDACRSAYRDWNREIRHPYHLFGGFRVVVLPDSAVE